MRKILILFLMLLHIGDAYSQESKYDSLKNLVREASDDSTRFWRTTHLVWAYLYSEPDSVEGYIKSNILLAEKIRSDRALTMVYYQYASLEQINGNYPGALQYGFYSLRAAERSKTKTLIASSYSNLGDIYREAGDLDQAIDKLQKAKSLFMSQLNPVIEEGEKNGDIYSYAVCITLLSQAFEKLNQPDSAMAYIKIVENLHNKRVSNDPFFPRILSFIKGNLSLQTGDYPAALNYYSTGATMAMSQDVKKDVMDNYNGKAKTFWKTGQLDSAIFYAISALDIGTRVRNISGRLDAFNLLADVYKKKHNADSVAKYLELTVTTRDSLFNQQKAMHIQSFAFNEELRQQEIIDREQKYKSRIRTYVFVAALFTLLGLAGILFRNNRQKQKAKMNIEKAYEELKAAQSQLIQSEKMASLGELTAGIAHEIQNPLNFVNNFSEVNNELIEEVKNKKEKIKKEELDELLNDIYQNNEKINHHGKRADAIVKGMLQHSRSSSGQKEPTDINALCDEYLRLSYHGLRAKDNSFNATIKTDFDNSIEKINIIPQDIGRVLLNLYNNAFYAVNERKKITTGSYEPTVTLSTRHTSSPLGGHGIEIKVIDNGGGMPQNIVDKIFQPFFTTKPTGQGTGLGLSLSYDIIKAHGSEIKVETTEGIETTFTIRLPIV